MCIYAQGEHKACMLWSRGLLFSGRGSLKQRFMQLPEGSNAWRQEDGQQKLAKGASRDQAGRAVAPWQQPPQPMLLGPPCPATGFWPPHKFRGVT
jgi:hypothetical protein